MVTPAIEIVIIFHFVAHKETFISILLQHIFIVFSYSDVTSYHLSLDFHSLAHKIMSMDCEYSSREYQVVLRPDLVINSFETGVMRILNELTKIENIKTIQFKVSRSSLKFKDESLVQYILVNSRDSKDL